MKAIGSVKEDLILEKRASITPETVKKFKNINFSVFLEKKYADHLGISDEEYKNNGAVIYDTAKEVFKKSEIILKVKCPNLNEINFIEDNTILITTEKDYLRIDYEISRYWIQKSDKGTKSCSKGRGKKGQEK